MVDLQKAIKRLKEAAKLPSGVLIHQDATIQRFEFTFELTWKVIREFANFKGLETTSPRDAFRIASDLGLVNNPEVWFDFLKDRNLSTHLYNEDEAIKIFSHLPNFVSECEALIEKIESGLK